MCQQGAAGTEPVRAEGAGWGQTEHNAYIPPFKTRSFGTVSPFSFQMWYMHTKECYADLKRRGILTHLQHG